MPTPDTAGIDTAAVDAVIERIDGEIGRLLDAILHHPAFQRLERAWRGLFFVVERARFDQGVRVELLNCSKADLRAACERWPDEQDGNAAVRCALYRAITSTDPDHVAPVGTIVGDYEFDCTDADVALLRRCAEVAHELHAPFITAAGASFWGLTDYRELADVGDLFDTLGRSERLEPFRMLRRHDSARYLAMVLPRILLRAPHSAAADAGDGYRHTERVVNHEHRCWGNAAYPLASRIAASFADYGWGANIAGVDGGGLLDVDVPDGPPSMVEVVLSPAQFFGLAGRGLIGLSSAPDRPPCFHEVPSVAQPRSFGRTPAGLATNFNELLACLLPYQFIASRLAHCVRLFHHRHGGVTDPPALAKRTQSWLYQYVHDTEVPTPASRGRCPFRSAKFEIVPTSQGVRWMLHASPMYPYQGDEEPDLEGMTFFTLSVSGALV